jgi:hypothetical protein
MSPRWWLPLLGVALVVTWWAASRLNTPTAQRLQPDPACDLTQGPCSLPLPDGGSISLALTPRPPKVMVPLSLRVDLEGPAAAVWVDFVGLNMEMGFNRAELTAGPGGLWQGQIILPICTAAEMQWEARVYIQQDHGQIEAPFAFATRP